jgi:hypothetical protein
MSEVQCTSYGHGQSTPGETKGGWIGAISNFPQELRKNCLTLINDGHNIAHVVQSGLKWITKSIFANFCQIY